MLGSLIKYLSQIELYSKQCKYTFSQEEKLMLYEDVKCFYVSKECQSYTIFYRF